MSQMGVRIHAVMLCVMVAGILTGCAEGRRGAISDRPATEPSALAQERAQEPVAQPSSQEEAFADDLFDPFATADESTEDYDPWEPVNLVMFEVNRTFDRYALKPLAEGYDWVMPEAAQRGVANFFHNIRTAPRMFNNLMQGKWSGAGIELGRFLLNTTFGLGGFFDVATPMEIETPDEDFGQTLGVYGVPPGPYLVIPLLPPFTLRDATGFVVDLALDPINWLVFPIIEVNNVPSLVSHPNRMTSTVAQLGGRSAFILNERSLNLESFQGVEDATVDLYSAVRNGYLQRRAKAIQE